MTTSTDSTDSARWTLIDAIERLDCAGLDSSELQAQLDALDAPAPEFIWHNDNALAPSTVPGMVRIAYRLDGDRQQRGIWRAVDVPADFAHGHDNDHLDWVLWDRLQEVLHDVEGPGADLDDMHLIGAVARPAPQSTSDICDEAAAMFDRLMHQNADCPHGTGDKFAHMADAMFCLSHALRSIASHANQLDHVSDAHLCEMSECALSDMGLYLLDPESSDADSLSITDDREWVPSSGSWKGHFTASSAASFSFNFECVSVTEEARGIACDGVDSIAAELEQLGFGSAEEIAMHVRNYMAGVAISRLLIVL